MFRSPHPQWVGQLFSSHPAAVNDGGGIAIGRGSLDVYALPQAWECTSCRSVAVDSWVDDLNARLVAFESFAVRQP
eukprot:2432343-Pyramimonas_sp.AAC.1